MTNFYSVFNAVREGDLKKVKTLIESGCDVNIQDEDGMTLLILAASLGHSKIVKFLINSGADVNQINKNAQTVDEHDPLSAAIFNDHKEIADYLTSRVKPKRKKKSAKNALFQAVQDANYKAIQTLLENYEVDVNICRPGVWSKNGYSILMDAAEAGQLSIVELLLEAGANPNYADEDEGKTAMLCAVTSCNSEVVLCLIEAGANVDSPNVNGKTPLMRAAELGLSRIVEMLIEFGADVKATDNGNMSVAWYAEKMGYTEIASVIQSAASTV